MSDNDFSEVCRLGSASRITRYWLELVKTVETMRWPYESYSALSIVAGVMPKRAAWSRSISTKTESPWAEMSLETSPNCGSVLNLSTSFGVHSASWAGSASCRMNWYCVRL